MVDLSHLHEKFEAYLNEKPFRQIVTPEQKMMELGHPLPPAHFAKTHNQFHRYGKQKQFWVLYREGVTFFGNWKTGWQHCHFDKQSNNQDAEERRRRVALLQRMRQEEEEERKKRQEAAASKAQSLWQSLPEAGASPYLASKGVGAYGLRFNGNKLVIPLRDIDGKLWSLQTIMPDGSKWFTKDGRKHGCFHTIGTLQGASMAFVVEGYATGASVHLATGNPVVVAFDSGNLEPVIAALRKVYPSLPLTIAADDDRWPNPATGKASHTGERKAKEAAQKYRCNVILPRFSGQYGSEATK